MILPTGVRVETRTGEAILPLLPALARLRAAVFREWPYLYEGGPDYETDYMRAYAASPGAAVVLAMADGEPVGAATCLPLADETPNLRAPFEARGWDPGRFFYFGESVLLPAWRGRGIGVAFFAAREAHARAASDCDWACFCAVAREASDPRRPAGFVPLEGFWRRRGYRPVSGLSCAMRWREIGADAAAGHRMDFWVKSLTGRLLP